MAEFLKIAREYKRLCDASKTCKDCPLYNLVERVPNCEAGILRRFPEEAERIITLWVAEHPIKTNGMKFKEVFGDRVVWETDEDMEAWLCAEYKGEDNG